MLVINIKEHRNTACTYIFYFDTRFLILLLYFVNIILLSVEFYWEIVLFYIILLIKYTVRTVEKIVLK